MVALLVWWVGNVQAECFLRHASLSTSMGGTSPHDLVFATTMLEGHGLSAAQIRQLFSHGRLTKSVTRRAGQTVGTHTWSHKDLARNPYANDIEQAEQEIETHEHDVVIRLSGEILKRKKKLSKKYYGTSHVVSKDEAKFVFERGCEQLIVGSGQMGNVHLSPEAEAYFAKKNCKVILQPTPKALHVF